MDHLLNCIHAKKKTTVQSSWEEACYSSVLKKMLVGGK